MPGRCDAEHAAAGSGCGLHLAQHVLAGSRDVSYGQDLTVCALRAGKGSTNLAQLPSYVIVRRVSLAHQ